MHNKSWGKATLILMAYILWLHSHKTRDFDRLLLCVFIIKLYGKRYRAPPVEYESQTEWKSERRWWFNRIIKPLRTDMYETHSKTTLTAIKRHWVLVLFSLSVECMALNMPERHCYQQTINNSDVWCFHKHFIFIFLCSCLCCLLFLPPPTPDRLDCCFVGFFSIFIILSAGKFTGIDFEGISRSTLVTAYGWTEEVKPMELTVGGEKNSCCEYHFCFLRRSDILQSVFSNDSFFCCFIRKRGVGEYAEFMFLTVKEIFLPMHTPRFPSPFAIISVLNIWQLYTWVIPP